MTFVAAKTVDMQICVPTLMVDLFTDAFPLGDEARQPAARRQPGGVECFGVGTMMNPPHRMLDISVSSTVETKTFLPNIPSSMFRNDPHTRDH